MSAHNASLKTYVAPALVTYGDVRTLTGAVGTNATDDFVFINGNTVPNPPGFEQGSENLCNTTSMGNGDCETS